MPRSTKRKLWAAIAAGSIGILCQFPPAGCVDYGISLGVSSFDFCSIVNCTGGQFIDLCEPVPLLVDCPNYAEGDGDG